MMVVMSIFHRCPKMNTNGVARHYDKLTAWERVPLMLAALNRGDETEAERLALSAPTHAARVPHYHGLWLGLSLLSAVHQMQKLEQLCVIVAAAGLMAAGKLPEGEGRRQWQLAAQLFVAEADAWKLLCADLQIDPDAVLRHLPGYSVAQLTAEAARLDAFTPEEAAAWMREKGHDPSMLLTTESELTSMRAVLQSRMQWWA
jgi:hypothetical protein